MTSPVILALDCSTEQEVWQLLSFVSPDTCAVKVGFQLFGALGPSIVRALVDKKYRVFLDLKFHDIPNTVANACMAAADLGVWMINVHALGGPKMMSAAVQALSSYGANGPLLIGVTVLTSLSDNDLQAIGIAHSSEMYVPYLANLSYQAGLDGVVCSAWEVPLLKDKISTTFVTVTPGIRFNTRNLDDQTRTTTPEDALTLGSDYIVMGRSLTSISDRQLMSQHIQVINALKNK